MSQNNQYYRDFVTGYYENVNWNMDALKSIVIRQLKDYGISERTKRYLINRKWDMTNDYMLDKTDAVESYIKNNSKPSYKHACAVLLEGEY